MYQVPPHQSLSNVRPIAALVLATVMFIVFAMSLTDPGRGGGDRVRPPLQAPVGLGL